MGTQAGSSCWDPTLQSFFKTLSGDLGQILGSLKQEKVGLFFQVLGAGSNCESEGEEDTFPNT